LAGFHSVLVTPSISGFSRFIHPSMWSKERFSITTTTTVLIGPPASRHAGAAARRRKSTAATGRLGARALHVLRRRTAIVVPFLSLVVVPSTCCDCACALEWGGGAEEDWGEIVEGVAG
jgi:hypothetical protein